MIDRKMDGKDRKLNSNVPAVLGDFGANVPRLLENRPHFELRLDCEIFKQRECLMLEENQLHSVSLYDSKIIVPSILKH